VNLFVPAPTAVLAAPSMIAHYIVDHAYRPPDPFLHAIARWPVTRGRTYVEALVEAGPRDDPEWERGLIHALSFHDYLARERRRLEASSAPDAEELAWLREAEPDPSLCDLQGWAFLAAIATRALAGGEDDVHDAAAVLGAIGPAAREATPALERALSRVPEYRRAEVEEAIRRVNGGG
jgi:hypothetical protein